MWDLRFYSQKKNDAALMDKFARLSTHEAKRGLDFSKTYATGEGVCKNLRRDLPRPAFALRASARQPSLASAFNIEDRLAEP